MRCRRQVTFEFANRCRPPAFASASGSGATITTKHQKTMNEDQPRVPAGSPEGGEWTSDSASSAPKMEVTLHRATTDVTDVKTVPSGTSWTPDKETAKAYTDNPGFGGDKVVQLKVNVPQDRVLDVRGNSARDLNALAKAVGGDAQQWRDDGLTTVPQVIEERSSVAKALKEKADWVILKDDFPENATTWRKT